jgi:drug/metabolite transporter (DMT)-like permease
MVFEKVIRMPYILIASSILLGAVAQILLKLGAIRAGSLDLFKLFTNAYTIMGLFCYAFSALFWIAALTKTPLSIAYPMVSLGYIIVFGLSYFIFGETITLLRIAGLLTIVAGVLMIAKS